ncbi:MAG: MBL fold metallo-hydrolase, partial [Ktedonobacteraceae bacterium]|nr:MBL fold metallo-hydrolase [Ktedonobacteraceae bacterium]
MRVVSLASSSSGNALLIEAGPRGRTKLLVDAGLNTRQLIQRLHSIGVRPEQLQGVLVTHEHSDHVQGLPALMKRYTLPVITDPRTYQALQESITAGFWYTDTGNMRMIKEAAYEIDNGQSTTLSTSSLPVATNGTIESLAIALPIGSHRLIGDIEVTSFPTSHDAVAPCGYLLRAGGCRVCIA